MRLREAMERAGRHWIHPVYSLFGVSSKNEYTTLLNGEPLEATAQRFEREAREGNFAGLEVRCNGMRVNFD